MGDVFWGLHAPLAARIIDKYGITTAIETGTYFGAGALQLAALCNRVVSIERDKKLTEFNRENYRCAQHVQFISGNAAQKLAEVLVDVADPTLFVLDAHWSPTSRLSGQDTKQCYVTEELEAILPWLGAEKFGVVMIDDAQFFLGSLGLPYKRSDFPSITEVVDTLRRACQYVTVTDDVIVGGPADLQDVIEHYLRWRDELGFPHTAEAGPRNRLFSSSS